MRFYCWRVGCVFEYTGGVCPECSSKNHREYEKNDCGSCTRIDGRLMHCELPIGHSGKCGAKLMVIADVQEK